MAELLLTPLEPIDRIAALVPPPRTHRHRYFGVLAPNSPLRAAVTAFVTPAQPATEQAGFIELEVIESTALEDLARIGQVIEECPDMGVFLALDDFSAG